MKIRSSLTRNTFALTMTPVALCLEELMPSNHTKTRIYSILIRTALVISTLIVGLSVPFFGKSLVIFSPASFCKIYATVQFCSNHRIYIYIFNLMNLFCCRSCDGIDRIFTHNASGMPSHSITSMSRFLFQQVFTD